MTLSKERMTTKGVYRRAMQVLGVTGLIALTLAAGQTAQAATYYMATNGRDSNPGTISQPFASCEKGYSRCNAGDTLYVRGGVYNLSGFRADGIRLTGRNGSGSSARIKIWAYQGETPIFDCTNQTYDASSSGLFVSASWLHLRGLTIRNEQEANNNSWSVGIAIRDSSNNIFERITAARNEGAGIQIIGNSANNTLLNCDSYSNYDPKTNGGDADGIQITGIPANATGNRISGCRVYGNGDDGIDLWESEAPIVVENTWSFFNGYVPGGSNTPAGNGMGFKLGRNDNGPRHNIRRCLAFQNRGYGFVDNNASGPSNWYNNTSYQNDTGFTVYIDIAHRLRNNVSAEDVNAAVFYYPNTVDDTYNSWNLPVSATSSDFVSVDTVSAQGARQSNGDLPNYGLLQLRSGSDLIDKGTDVGLSGSDRAPNLGAY